MRSEGLYLCIRPLFLMADNSMMMMIGKLVKNGGMKHFGIQRPDI